MSPEELEAGRGILAAFAATGAPPPSVDPATLRALAERHVVVLDGDGEIVMAHPFAAHTDGTRVTSGARTWWGNCAWDGLGIVAALRLRDADVASGDVVLRVRDGELLDTAPVFHVLVPAARWWEDIGFT